MPLALAFIFGLLASAFSLMLEIIFLPGLFAAAGASALGLSSAALIEEASKVLFLAAGRKRGFFADRDWKRLSAGALAFGLGFAATEASLSALRETLWQSGSLFTAALHIVTSFILVWGFSSRTSSLVSVRLAGAFLAAFLVHLAYNLAVFTA